MIGSVSPLGRCALLGPTSKVDAPGGVDAPLSVVRSFAVRTSFRDILSTTRRITLSSSDPRGESQLVSLERVDSSAVGDRVDRPRLGFSCGVSPCVV